jgi:hypothetical protein
VSSLVLSHHRAKAARRSRGQRGYVMVLFALLLIPILLITGLAVDVGSWYNKTTDIQKASDAAALAGVVWLPDLVKAEAAARTAATRNGYTDGVNDVTVQVSQIGDRRLRVTITDNTVGSFFYQNLGGRQIKLGRKASAEYVLPVPLGSPENRLGNDPTASPAYTPNLWGSISAPYTKKEDGDPFSTKCSNTTSGTGCTQSNTEYRNWGYIYVIDVPASEINKNLTVQVYDAGHYARANFANFETADYGTVNTEFELYRPDDTPLNSLDGLTATNSLKGKCTSGPGEFYAAANEPTNTYKNVWKTLCTVKADEAGQWLLQVKSSNIPGVVDAGTGFNQYSLKATLSGTVQPALFSYGDLSLFNNLPNLSGTFTSTFYLAKIDQIHAGKTLQVSMFDPGDGASGTYYVNILGPGGVTTACGYGVRGAVATNAAICRINSRTSGGAQPYQGQWLDVTIKVPTTYTCSTDCWWKVKYEFVSVAAGSSPYDRTVWAARVIGDPVHLIEE